MSYIEAIVIAIIEGLTEFLPVSSTGHMIIASSVMGIATDPFTKLFTVAIQLGAILAVVVLYWKRFFQSLDFYFKIGVAFIPAVIAGLFLKDHIDQLLESVDVVGYSLLLGGIFFLFIDKIFPLDTPANGAHLNQQSSSDDVLDPVNPKKNQSDLSYGSAFAIGSFQIISMIPGVSRSAATII